MKDAFVTSVNTALSATAYFNELSLNAFNMDTPGYRQKNIFFSDFINGANMEDRHEWKTFQGKAIPGRSDTNMMIEGKAILPCVNRRQPVVLPGWAISRLTKTAPWSTSWATRYKAT
ncbi:MAG: hypothetical protein R2857_14855 [Vampirovibrionales bacterium]